MSSNQSRSIITNFIWRFAERIGVQGVALVVSIVLARLLDPEAYGTIALVMIFTAILQVFVDSGLGNALIQKKNADQLDFSTVFYFNIVMCLMVYGLLYMAAPWIATFYGDPQLTAITRVLGLTLVISGLRNIQQAYVSRNLIFKKFFYSTLGATIVAACTGILMAYMGFGVWALVAQQLTNAAVGTLILFFTVKWRPTWEFSFTRFKQLFSFGWKLLVSALLDTGYNNLWQLVIGKFYTNQDLAHYNQGDKIPYMIVQGITTSIDGVLLPVMSNVQEDTVRIKAMTKRTIITGTYVMAPLMLGLAFVAPAFVSTLLTDKWLPCVFYLRISCVCYLFFPIHTANLNAIKAMGRSDWFLKLEIAKKLVGLVTLLVSVPYGVKVMAMTSLVCLVTGLIINAYPNWKLMDYGFWEQMKDIFPCLLLAVFMGVCTLPVAWIGLGSFVTLVLQVLVGAVVYLVGSIILRMESFQYLWEILKSFVMRVVG